MDSLESSEVPPPVNKAGDTHSLEDLAPAPDDELHFFQMELDESTPPHPTFDAPSSCKLSVRDSAIKCCCPTGTARRTKELAFAGVGETGPMFVHLACNPHKTALSKGIIFDTSMVKRGLSEETHNTESVFLTMLGPEPTPEQRLKTKNFTSQFSCDGPCRGSKNIQDYFLCRKCCAWQHRQCMLFGDAEMCPNPVCNRCYLDFITFRDEIVRAQRKRLLMVVKEAWEFLKDPENQHQAWRRAWCRKFIARFINHNQADYHCWVVSRRGQRQSLVLPLRPRATAASVPLSSVSRLDAEGKPIEHKRKESKMEPTSVNQDDDIEMREETDIPLEGAHDEDDDDDDDDGDYVDSDDDFRPPRRTRYKPRTSRAALKKVVRTCRTTRPPSFTPPGPESQIYRSSAPRKSVRKPSDEDKPQVENGDEYKGHSASCTCRSTPPPPGDCFRCIKCPLLQHNGCAHDNQDGLPVLCNFCFNWAPAESASQLEIRSPLLSAPSPRASKSPEEFDAAILDESDQLCATILWKTYTSSLNAGNELPRYPPMAWLEEIQLRTRELLQAAGHEQIKKFLVPVLSFPRQPRHIVKAFREIALEQLRRGAYRSRPDDLGLLLEVVELVAKGTYWKGNLA